ncbi:MAG: short-chain dehydrogenase, partial [Gammaproteobacteria bacterium]|nr:short-chain dehydrogenase [Gammaproteobacteria bacterium]
RQGIPPEEAAKGLIARIDELDMKKTGTFWHQSGEALPW